LSTAAILKQINFESIFIEDLDSYIEMFYEEAVEQKIKGSISILYLCLSNENMEYMLQHG
jgi:hypothetical protein